jgi:heme-degrading monooxygenase HmoA
MADQPVTAIVLFQTQPEHAEELVRLARATQPIFARQPGFLGRTMHVSEDGRRIVEVLRWRTRADNDACFMSPDWQGPEGHAFMGFVGSGKATMEPQVYSSEAYTEGSAAG